MAARGRDRLTESSDNPVFFCGRIHKEFEPEICEVLAGVGDLRRRLFPVHCISLKDPSPHQFNFTFVSSLAARGTTVGFYRTMHVVQSAVLLS